MCEQKCKHLTLSYSQQDDDGFNDYHYPYRCKDCDLIFWVDNEDEVDDLDEYEERLRRKG